MVKFTTKFGGRSPLICPSCHGNCREEIPGFCRCFACGWQGDVLDTMDFRFTRNERKKNENSK